MKSFQIEQIFNQCFVDFQVRLSGGGAEPFYQPVSDSSEATAVLTYRQDFASSALHEIAHWCLAGAERRKLQDFGYWYAPDGRTQEQQQEFYQVEVKPQALEWIFADAAGMNFVISADNLDAPDAVQSESFKNFADAVCQQKSCYLIEGMPKRAGMFRTALQEAKKI